MKTSIFNVVTVGIDSNAFLNLLMNCCVNSKCIQYRDREGCTRNQFFVKTNLFTQEEGLVYTVDLKDKGGPLAELPLPFPLCRFSSLFIEHNLAL